MRYDIDDGTEVILWGDVDARVDVTTLSSDAVAISISAVALAVEPVPSVPWVPPGCVFARLFDTDLDDELAELRERRELWELAKAEERAGCAIDGALFATIFSKAREIVQETGSVNAMEVANEVHGWGWMHMDYARLLRISMAVIACPQLDRWSTADWFDGVTDVIDPFVSPFAWDVMGDFGSGRIAVGSLLPGTWDVAGTARIVRPCVPDDDITMGSMVLVDTGVKYVEARTISPMYFVGSKYVVDVKWSVDAGKRQCVQMYRISEDGQTRTLPHVERGVLFVRIMVIV